MSCVAVLRRSRTMGHSMKSKILGTASAGLLIAAMGICTVPALAATDVTFDATGTFADGSTLGGSLVIDTTGGTVVSTDLTFSGAPSSDFNIIAFQGFNPTPDSYEIFAESSTSPDELRLLTISTSLVGFGGGPFASIANPSPNSYSSDWQDAAGNRTLLNSGGLTAVPLPASVWLMLSGLVGVGAMARMRRAA
jgi:hypothetical protein